MIPKSTDKQPTIRARVLHVDADVRQRAIVEVMLSRTTEHAIDLDGVGSLTEARERLKKVRYDVCLLDLGLPDASGTEAVRAVRVAAPALPIVVVAEEDDPWAALASVKLGAVDFLIKDRLHPTMLMRSIVVATCARRLPSSAAVTIAADESTVGIVVRAEDGAIRYCNAVARQLLASDPELLDVAKRLAYGQQGSIWIDDDKGEDMVLVQRSLVQRGGLRQELLTLTVTTPNLRMLPRSASGSRRDSGMIALDGYAGPERRSRAPITG